MYVTAAWLREAYEAREPEKIDLILEALRKDGKVEVFREPVFEAKA